MSALLVPSTPSSFTLCWRFPAKMRLINMSLQMNVQESVCHPLFSWKFRSSLMPRVTKSAEFMASDLSACSRTFVPTQLHGAPTQLCREGRVSLSKGCSKGTNPPSWSMCTHRMCSWTPGCQTGIWSQAQFRGGSDFVLVSAKHPEHSQPTLIFYYCILIWIFEVLLESQKIFRLHCADMNKNYSKHWIWPSRHCCQKSDMDHTGEMGRSKRYWGEMEKRLVPLLMR